jgi:hypothetical protein
MRTYFVREESKIKNPKSKMAPPKADAGVEIAIIKGIY